MSEAAAAAVKAEETEEVEATTEDAKVADKSEKAEETDSGESTQEERDELREKFIADGIAAASKMPEASREMTTKVFTDITNEAFDAVEEATQGMSLGQVAAFVFGYSVAATKQ